MRPDDILERERVERGDRSGLQLLARPVVTCCNAHSRYCGADDIPRTTRERWQCLCRRKKYIEPPFLTRLSQRFSRD